MDPQRSLTFIREREKKKERASTKRSEDSILTPYLCGLEFGNIILIILLWCDS